MKPAFLKRYMALFIGLAGICIIACQSSPKKGDTEAQSGDQSMSGQGGNGAMMGQTPKMAENVSDEEMTSFLEANEKMSSIQQSANQQMGMIIKGEGLSPQRYNEIARAQNKKSGKANATGEEMQKIRNINEKVRPVQKDAQEKSINIIKEAGLTPQSYQQIGMAIQNRQDLQQKYRQMMMEKQK